MKKIIKKAVEDILKKASSGKETWEITHVDEAAVRVSAVRDRNTAYSVSAAVSCVGVDFASKTGTLLSQAELQAFADASAQLKAIRADDNTAYQIASQRAGRLCAHVRTVSEFMDALDNLPPTIYVALAGYRDVRFCIVRTIDHMYNLTLVRGDANPDEYGTTLDVVRGDTLIELLNGRAGQSYAKLHTALRYEEECLPLQFRFIPLNGGESRPLVISYDKSLIEE